MSQLTNSSSQFKKDKETDNDNVFINIYNTSKENEITSTTKVDKNTNSNNNTSYSSIEIDSSSAPNNYVKSSNNTIENPFETPPSSNSSSPIPAKNSISTPISNNSTPISFRNSINTPITNNNPIATNNPKQNKEEIVNIDILNPNENSINTSTDININFKPSINENTNNPHTSKQFNINSQEDEEENITANTSILENGRNNDKSFSSKKTVKTAITFDLNKKKKIEKNDSDSDDDSNENDKERKGKERKGKGKVSEYCPVCKAKASYMCSSCGPVVFYCSQSCQIAHWPEHRLVCKGVKRKRKSVVEHKKTESIFGEIIDPTVGSDAIVGTRNVAQLINLKRSRTENGKSKTSSVLSNRKSSTTRLLKEEEDSEEGNEENELSNPDLPSTSQNNDDVNTPLTGIKTDNKYMDKDKLKNSDDESNSALATSENKKENDKKKKIGYRKRTSMIIAKAQEDEELMEDLKFYIKQIFLIIKPVLICIFLTIAWVKLTNEDNKKSAVDPSYIKLKKNTNSFNNYNDNSSNILVDLQSALYFIGQMIFITVVVALLFIFSCVKTLTSLYIILMMVLLSIFSYITLYTIVSIYNIPIDILTTGLFIWNIVVVGLVVIFWKGPLKIQQYYLVFVSSLMAYSFTKFSEMTTWIILGLLAVWDLIAVLCPFGPLRLLLKHSEENQQEIPALLYTLMVWIMATPASPKVKGTIQNPASDENSNTQNVHNNAIESSNTNKTKSSDKKDSSKSKDFDTSFANEVLSIFDMKNASSSPPVSPKQQAVNLQINKNKNTNGNSNLSVVSSSSNNLSKRNSNFSNNGLLTAKQQQSSRPLSVSSVVSSASGSVTLTRKKTATLKRYPSNSSIISGSHSRPASLSGSIINRPSSPSGSVILTNRPPSVSLRPPFTGSISDENATTATLFQDNSNSYDSMRSLSRNNSIDSQRMKKRLEKKYKYNELARLYGTTSRSDRRINRSSHHHYHHYNHRSAYASNHSYDDSSFLSDESSSEYHNREASFSSVAPLVNNKSQTSSFNEYSYHHHHHHHHKHHSHRNENDSGLTISQTSSTTSIIHRSHSHRHKSRYSSMGPGSDIYSHMTEEEYQKKKKKREKRLRKEKERKERQRKEDEEEEAERNGIKLGLGDFVFYSVLVAKAASKDWMTTINCTVAVITGLTITIFLLALFKKALPALPISIAFGLIFYFASQVLINQLMEFTTYVAYFGIGKSKIYNVYEESIKEVQKLYNVEQGNLYIGKKYMGYVHF